MIKILFVCLGNICRSPLAEAIFREKSAKIYPGKALGIDSAGTGNYHVGEGPDPRTVEVAKKNQIPIQHTARQFNQADFYEFDYILAMDRENLADIESLNPGDGKAQILLMREFDPAESMDVPDPYFGGQDGFDQVFSILDEASENFLKYLQEKHPA